MDQYIGKFLDNRYEILERIGVGGMAQVYKAKCHWLNRYVAIKILKDDLAQDEEFTRRFHEESQAVAMLSHPNIVSVYDVSRSGDPDYIVMELIEGITLKQYMQKRGGKLTWKEALHFITQIMKGLSHAHSRGIIHRDIKPHNIMILRDGSVKVTDFGIARLASNRESTMTQEAIGSVHYISPEQARGSHIDARSDIYSAGIVLYEMLTGRLPYEGDSPVAVAVQHINSVPLSPGDLDPTIPEALVEITMKAMASDVERRYLSADAMLSDLEEFRKNPNISFDYTTEDLTPSGEDEPTQNIGANTPAIAPVTPVHAERLEDSGSLKRVRVAEPVEEAEEEEERNSPWGMIITVVLAVALLAGAAFFLWNNVIREMMETGQTYMVPDLKGYTLEEAMALPAVTGDGFTVVEGMHVVSADIPEGQIVGQNPSAGDMVKAGGQEITVEISAGGEGIKVPDVYNKDQRVADGILRAAGLKVEVKEATSDDITKGNVISQDPAPQTEVEEGETVTITVSLGRQFKDVPMITVTGMTLEDATRAIEELGLKLGNVTPEHSDRYEQGRVTYQSIQAYALIKEGTAVALRVSSGPEIVAPPEATQTVQPTPQATPAQTPQQSPEATPEQTPERSEAPQPTVPAIGPSRVKSGTVNLPLDRDTVAIQVTVGGTAQFSEPQVVETRMRVFRFNVSGSGTQEIVVYIDGVAAKSYTENFDS